MKTQYDKEDASGLCASTAGLGELKKWQVNYYYLATGMEGRADKEDYGVVDAVTSDEAVKAALMRKHPVDIMYGPNNAYSTNEFIRKCLTATEVPNHKGGEP